MLATYVDALGTVRHAPRETVRLLREAIAAHAPKHPTKVCVVDVGSKVVEIDGDLDCASGDTHLMELEDGGEISLRFQRHRENWSARAPSPIPLGVHRIRFKAKQLFVLSRPRTLSSVVVRGKSAKVASHLALFLPLCAATPGGAFGIGSYTDLRTLCDWARQFGEALIGTLPLFPAFLDKPFDPSPYAPITRLMWNELFVDPTRAPEWRERSARSTRKRAMIRSSGDSVDYRKCWSLARRTLSDMAQAARRSPSRWSEVLASCSADVVEYARFRAIVDASGKTWDRWPSAWRRLERTPANPRDIDMYLYAQSLAMEQVRAIGRSRGARSSPLYLDVPVGVHGGGFDTYSNPELFMQGFSAGAPPDDLNAHGQVWGFPPIHPTAGRENGYLHLRSVLRRMFAVAGVLRIDHVMGLYRMYCVPKGFDGAAGAYMRYPEEELFAIVMIEAARAGAVVVGEDLGTVPQEVRAIMARRGILGMHVQQFSSDASARPIRLPSSSTLACLNTHDTPTFAGFWHGDDIALRQSLGHMTDQAAASERRGRTRLTRAITADIQQRGLPAAGPVAIGTSLMRLQATSRAPMIVVNLEDLWGERRPQNVPGTSTEYPNWRRRSRKSIQKIVRSRDIAKAIGMIEKKAKVAR